MTAATITQAQGKGLRQLFADYVAIMRDFSAALYAARDREFGMQHAARATVETPAPTARELRASRRTVLSMAAEAEQHSPSLAAELRYLASRG